MSIFPLFSAKNQNAQKLLGLAFLLILLLKSIVELVGVQKCFVAYKKLYKHVLYISVCLLKPTLWINEV